jgi:hypothetical protein
MVRDVIYSEGVKYVAETVEADWLIDEIAFAQKHAPQLRNKDFKNRELVVSAGGSAELFCDDGNGPRLYAKQIDWTDFPSPGVRFYFCNDTILLPSEYGGTISRRAFGLKMSMPGEKFRLQDGIFGAPLLNPGPARTSQRTRARLFCSP